MVIENEIKIKKWARKLTVKELEVVVLTIEALFDFANPSSSEDEKQEIELNAFTSKLVSVKDALHWTKEISKLLGVSLFLVKETPIVISSVPYHSSRTNRIYARITKDFFRELTDFYVVLKDVLSLKPRKEEPAIDKKKLVKRDGRGVFWYDEKEIKMSLSEIYYQVFDALYTFADQNGFVSYEDIEKYLVQQYRRPPTTDMRKRNKRISNALSKTQGLFRYAKVNNRFLKNKTLDGRNLIKIVWGKGITFYNPKV
ncbi:hypothetical protein L6250_03680 [Candidatus Parcubacteria bacterium]|nr:hypothetical protein [Candidatus Parcubacteria bacterium]